MNLAIPDKNQAGIFFDTMIRLLLCLLLFAILASIGIGIANLFNQIFDLALSRTIDTSSHNGLQTILVGILGVLAMVEVFRTAMAYFIEGRVKVTYIIDTVLVALLTEVLAFWYRDMETSRVVMLLALVVVLMLLRILAIRFSPYRRALSDGL
ncbi:MAG: phosphate-starvation-inducible PsiE family protein [Desulfuromonadales bacterium]|nr:phosphate-starvation-inducible PsiE family protein [Desulfuromonadales bacterium]